MGRYCITVPGVADAATLVTSVYGHDGHVRWDGMCDDGKFLIRTSRGPSTDEPVDGIWFSFIVA